MAVRFRYLWLVLLLFGSGAMGRGLRAQDVADTTLVLPDVTVTATRMETTTTVAASRVTVIDAAALEASGAQDIAELLAGRTGAFLRRYGDGGLATISLRGTGASQTLVLLDGHRIADPQLGQLDLSLLPTILLESVEVMPGAASPLYGTDALGGVVNLRTRRAAGRQLRAQGGYGAFGERTGTLMISETTGSFSGLALVEFVRAEGDYPYLDKGLFPPGEVRRAGADRAHLSFYSTLGYTGTQSRLRAGAWYGDAERGVPTLGSSRPREERQWDEHLRLWADGDRRFGWGTLRLGGLVQQSALRYTNPFLGLDETGRTRTAAFEAEAQARPGRHWLLAGGLETGFGRARHPSLAADAAEQHLGAFVHGTGHYGRLLLYPALRFDGYRADTSAVATVNPRLGLNLRILPDAALHLKASAGRAFRVPTFNDRFWQPGGNPDLKPERGWTYEAGLLWRHAWGEAEATFFLSRFRDQIVWAPTAAGFWAPDNVQRVHSRGLEASYRHRLAASRRFGLDGSLFYTLTHARDRSDPASRAYDQPLRHVPRHQLKGYLDARFGPVRAGLAGRYTGRRFTTTDGSRFLDPHFLLDAHLRLHQRLAGAEAALGLFVENMLDRRYEVLPAQPMPPRHARLQLTLTFD